MKRRRRKTLAERVGVVAAQLSPSHVTWTDEVRIIVAALVLRGRYEEARRLLAVFP